MRTLLRVGFGTAAIECTSSEQRALLFRQYAPMVLPNSDHTPVDLGLRWGADDTVEVTAGSTPRLTKRMSALEEIEWRIIQLLLEGASTEGGQVLHAGGVVYRGHPIVFLGPSGCGKSSLTRAALLRGASYVTDDLLVIKKRQIAGLARSVRFSDVPATGELPDWLKSAEFLPRRRLDERRVPVFPDCGPVQEKVELGERTVIVLVLQRGPDSIRELSAAERLVHLHQAALTGTGAYDGSLGFGPTWALTWTTPDDAFTRFERHYRSGNASS